MKARIALSKYSLALCLLLAGACNSLTHAQDITRLGGDLTSDFSPSIALELPAPNIRSREFFELHLEGHGDFHRSLEFTKLNGKFVVGPNFNHTSCGGCHVKDGRGPIRFAPKETGSAMLIKVSLRGLKSDGSPRNVPRVGEQLQDHTITGKSKYAIRLRWRKVRGQYGDGTRYTLRRPLLTFNIPNVDRKAIVTSLRMTPPTIGMGLLEAVPDKTIIAMSDPDDENHDGISGKVSLVTDLETKAKTIGRFGFRASHATLRQQSAAAFFNDMGMTSEIIKARNQQQEVANDMLDRVVFYMQAAGMVPARDQDQPDVSAGKQLFQQVKCDSCHKITLKTGDSAVPEVANQEIHPFTDLLLHDMGYGLSDRRPEFSATGREWRTTPLWGLGLYDVLSNEAPGFLHDGRARSIEEAILWHAGEAKMSRQLFMDLSSKERGQLIKFLRSL